MKKSAEAVDIIHLHARSSVRHRVTVHLPRMGDKHHQAIMLHREFRNHIRKLERCPASAVVLQAAECGQAGERVDRQNTAPPPRRRLVAPSQAPAPAWRSPSERYATRYGSETPPTASAALPKCRTPSGNGVRSASPPTSDVIDNRRILRTEKSDLPLMAQARPATPAHRATPDFRTGTPVRMIKPPPFVSADLHFPPSRFPRPVRNHSQKEQAGRCAGRCGREHPFERNLRRLLDGYPQAGNPVFARIRRRPCSRARTPPRQHSAPNGLINSSRCGPAESVSTAMITSMRNPGDASP